MSWAKLLASNRVTQQPSAKAELDSLRSIVARCFIEMERVNVVDGRQLGLAPI
jgi:hypothetical protein